MAYFKKALRFLKRSSDLVIQIARDFPLHLLQKKSLPQPLVTRIIEQARLLRISAITADDYYQLALNNPELSFLHKTRYLGSFKSNRYFECINPRIYDIVARDKALFHQIASSLQIPTPMVFATTSTFGKPFVGCQLDSISAVADFLRECEDIFLKPADGHFGEGAMSLGNRLEGNEKWVSLPSRDRVALPEVLSALKTSHDGSLGRFLIQRRLRPHPILAEIVPDVCPTVRIITLSFQGRTEFLGGALRLGNGSSPTDNFSGGGVAVKIDYKTGLLGPAYEIVSNKPCAVDSHPRTRVPIAGVTLPYWQKVQNLSLEGARKLSFIPLIAWDIGITDEGPVVVEINTHPGLRTIQLTQGEGLINDQLYFALSPYDGLTKSGLSLSAMRPQDRT